MLSIIIKKIQFYPERTSSSWAKTDYTSQICSSKKENNPAIKKVVGKKINSNSLKVSNIFQTI